MKPYRNLPKTEDFEAYRPSATARAAMQHDLAEPDDSLTKTQRVVSRICCLVAAGIMIETLFFKFTGADESKYIFHKMGTEPWWRWGQGIWELIASLCLLLPRMRWAGGLLGSAAMLAAILSHLTWLGISIQDDHGLLFGMALVTFTSSFTVVFIHRHEIPFVTPLSSW